MKAVNLIPPESRRGGHADIKSLRGPGSAVVGLLVVVLALVTMYVMASNDVTSRQGQLAGLRQQLSQTQALVSKLGAYTQFAALANARVETVKEIASGRFNWKQALSDLSRVVPANTSLTSVSATVNPSSGSAGGAGGASSGLRGDISNPAFELEGCTANQDDVARLMSRLRLMRGVTRVTLSDSVKSTGGPAPAQAASSTSTSGAKSGCGAGGPTFDLVVFFGPLPTVSAPTGPTGATGAAGVTPSIAGSTS